MLMRSISTGIGHDRDHGALLPGQGNRSRIVYSNSSPTLAPRRPMRRIADVHRSPRPVLVCRQQKGIVGVAHHILHEWLLSCRLAHRHAASRATERRPGAIGAGAAAICSARNCCAGPLASSIPPS